MLCAEAKNSSAPTPVIRCPLPIALKGELRFRKLDFVAVGEHTEIRHDGAVLAVVENVGVDAFDRGDFFHV